MNKKSLKIKQKLAHRLKTELQVNIPLPICERYDSLFCSNIKALQHI